MELPQRYAVFLKSMRIKTILAGSIFICLHLVAMAQPCDKKLRPLVLIHGFLGAGDNYASMLQHLYRGGYCPQRTFVYDWNTVSRGNNTEALDALVDSIRTLTGSAQVDMMGHSAGGGVAYAYLADSLRQAKVARYVHIGSTAAKALPGVGAGVPTLNVYSKGDYVVKGADIPGAQNLQFYTLDHFEVVTADSTAAAVYAFLSGKKVPSKAIPQKVKKPLAVSGRVLSLGENIPQPGARIEVRPVHSGKLGDALNATTTDAQGNYTLQGLQPQQPYAMFAYPVGGRPVVHFVPQVQPGEHLLYLRTLPAAGMVALLLNGLPKDSSQMALVAFSSNRAIQHGRDTLAVRGHALSTAAWANPSKTAIAWFLYDANSNRNTDLNLISLFRAAPFMRGIDMYIPSDTPYISIHHNQRSYQWPFIPASEAVCIAILQ